MRVVFRQYETHEVYLKNAERLFKNNLTEKQKKDFQEKQYFIVKGNFTKRLYMIKYGTRHHYPDIQNIYTISKFLYYIFDIVVPKQCYCYTINHETFNNIPYYDVFLAQKFAIECNELEFLRKAVVSYYVPS